MSIDSRRHQYGTVFGHWKIKESLGQGSGGKSAVFRLEHADSAGVESALKVVSLLEEYGSIQEMIPERKAEYERSCQEYSRLAAQEVLLMNELQGNTHIVDYLDHAFADWSDEHGFGRDMLIRMERLTDLRRKIRNGERFERAEIIKLGLHICEALILCHSKNILHRDIKPGNIFINKDGNYKLGDFGISRITDSSASFMASTGIGTPQYWAPEQTTGFYDNRVDIYSLGLVLYELSNGNRLPFATGSYVRESEVQRRMMGNDLPTPCNADAELADVILKACAYRPENRYPTAEAFRDALAALDDATLPPVAGPDTKPPVVGPDTKPPVVGPDPQPETDGGTNWTNVEFGDEDDSGGRGKRIFVVLLGILTLVAALVVGAVIWQLLADRDDGGPGGDGGETDPPYTEAPTEREKPAPAEVGDALMECVALKEQAKGYCCYHIPQVLLDNDRGTEISEQIYNELHPVLENRVYGMTTPGISGMYYSWGRRDNTLSVLVKTEPMHQGQTRYYTYHVNAKSGKLLEDDYIIKVSGLSKAAYLELLDAKLREFYASASGQIVPSVGEAGLNELIANSTAEENLNTARPYIGADGALCAVVGYYWFEGEGYDYLTVNLTGAAAPEEPVCTEVHDIQAILEAAEKQKIDELKSLYADAEVGDIITFGTYEQDYNLQNGRESIQWLVLAKEDGKLLVVSRYGLDCQRFNTTYSSVTWSTCSLRKWLNGDFYDSAFTDLEKALIPQVLVTAERNPYYNNDPGSDTYDYVYLLSTAEADKYFRSDVDRICYPTAYAKRRGDCFVHPTIGSGWWWLRNVGEYTTDASCINADGVIDYKDGSVNNNSAIVRPALWIDCE